MTLKELKDKIADSTNTKEYESLELNLKFPHIDFETHLKGLISIYEFVTQQTNGWNKQQDNLPDELSNSKKKFNEVKDELLKLINEDYSYSFSRKWDDIKREIENEHRYYFTYESPEANFLIKIYNEFPESFLGAYKFIINDISRNLDSRNNFIGMTMAYEFVLKDNSKILERRNYEKASIGKIRNDFMNYLNQSEEQISEYIKNTNDKFKEYSTSIDNLKELKEKNFNDWFELSQNQFDAFDETANTKVKDLEKTYEELLRLKKPAEYWNKRALVLKKEGQNFLKWLVGLVLFGCITLYLLLWLTPDGMLLSFITGQASAIKWSIVYVTFISLLAFGIRAISKAMFSSFHLARDAEEREQLTYVYLALIKESAIEEKDKNLIMQSLFSRSDTGLLKEDSGPTMPGNIPNKLMQ